MAWSLDGWDNRLKFRLWNSEIQERESCWASQFQIIFSEQFRDSSRDMKPLYACWNGLKKMRVHKEFPLKTSGSLERWKRFANRTLVWTWLLGLLWHHLAFNSLKGFNTTCSSNDLRNKDGKSRVTFALNRENQREAVRCCLKTLSSHFQVAGYVRSLINSQRPRWFFCWYDPQTQWK